MVTAWGSTLPVVGSMPGPVIEVFGVVVICLFSGAFCRLGIVRLVVLGAKLRGVWWYVRKISHCLE